MHVFITVAPLVVGRDERRHLLAVRCGENCRLTPWRADMAAPRPGVGWASAPPVADAAATERISVLRCRWPFSSEPDAF
eukprot:scaffold3180_cov399-Prasinococcus_capsulatus_cf.AAC.18